MWKIAKGCERRQLFTSAHHEITFTRCSRIPSPSEWSDLCIISSNAQCFSTIIILFSYFYTPCQFNVNPLPTTIRVYSHLCARHCPRCRAGLADGYSDLFSLSGHRIYRSYTVILKRVNSFPKSNYFTLPFHLLDQCYKVNWKQSIAGHFRKALTKIQMTFEFVR